MAVNLTRVNDILKQVWTTDRLANQLYSQSRFIASEPSKDGAIIAMNPNVIITTSRTKAKFMEYLAYANRTGWENDNNKGAIINLDKWNELNVSDRGQG